MLNKIITYYKLFRPNMVSITPADPKVCPIEDFKAEIDGLSPKTYFIELAYI